MILYVFNPSFGMRRFNTKNETGEPDDAEFFRRAMDEVVPLKKPARTVPKTKSGRTRQAAGRRAAATGDDKPANRPEAPASFCRAGIQKRYLDRLRRGHFPAEDRIDLHGMDSAACRRAVAAFLGCALQRRMRCVRIIHGKGLHSGTSPRLRRLTRQLLCRHPRVLAYTPCKPAQGGDGATDVLLGQD